MPIRNILLPTYIRLVISDLLFILEVPSTLPHFKLQFASDYGHGIFSDGFGTLGNVVVDESLHRKSEALTARAIKDSGIPALTIPNGEFKAYVSQIKVVLDLINLAHDTSNPQTSPNIIEIDS